MQPSFIIFLFNLLYSYATVSPFGVGHGRPPKSRVAGWKKTVPWIICLCNMFMSYITCICHSDCWICHDEPEHKNRWIFDGCDTRTHFRIHVGTATKSTRPLKKSRQNIQQSHSKNLENQTKKIKTSKLIITLWPFTATFYF